MAAIWDVCLRGAGNVPMHFNPKLHHVILLAQSHSTFAEHHEEGFRMDRGRRLTPNLLHMVDPCPVPLWSHGGHPFAASTWSERKGSTRVHPAGHLLEEQEPPE